MDENQESILFDAFRRFSRMSVYEDDKKILVFDFGGGTFDVTVASLNSGMIVNNATRGDMALGGHDIDLCLLNHCTELFK